MSFLEHLDELRKRIVQSLLGVVAGVGIGFAFINPIVNFILTPTNRVLPQGDEEPGDIHGARLALCAATRQVLRNGLDLIGVSAPERM